MLYGWEWVVPEAQLQLIHSLPPTPLASHLLSLQNTCSVQVLSLTFTDPLIYISLTDLCPSHCWRIIWRVVGSLICIGSSQKLSHYFVPPPASLHSWPSRSGGGSSRSSPRSALATSGEQITHKTCSLSRRITNLAQSACGTVRRN